MNIQRIFWLFTLSIGVLLILPRLLQDGMFMDGVIYAAVSNNLALGRGSLWNLTFSETFLTAYSEQLPLFFWIQSLFFKILGSSIYTERIFQIVLLATTTFNIHLIWKLLYPKSNSSAKESMTWLPVLFWLITPIVAWSYMHNVQETLMSLFATSAVYFILRGIVGENKSVLFIMIGGLFIFLCSFCKGFQGLFPLALIAIYWVVWRRINWKHMMFYSLLIVLVPLLILGLTWLFEDSRACLMDNFNNRILRTFNEANSSTTANRFKLIFRAFSELIPAMLLSLLLFFFGRKKRAQFKGGSNFNWALCFILIGVSASFPLIVTKEQRGFYLATSMPFYAIGLASLVRPFVAFYLEQIGTLKTKVLARIALALFVISIIISLSQIANVKRDKDQLHDVYAIGEYLNTPTHISVPSALRMEYGLVAYFSRHYHISLDMNEQKLNPYYLGEANGKIPLGFREVDLDLVKYKLYVKD